MSRYGPVGSRPDEYPYAVSRCEAFGGIASLEDRPVRPLAHVEEEARKVVGPARRKL